MDIFAQLNSELYDFFNKKVHIAGAKSNDSARYLGSRSKTYEFSQWEMVNLIDLYWNSKFESGMFDSEGQRKLFLNVGKFRSNVASKQIDFGVKDFVFLPEEGADEWGPTLLGREFRYWARENYLGELINQNVDNFPKYGWVVNKEVDGKLEHVPLQTLRNQQDAKSLNEARYVIIEHPNMTLDEMKSHKGWNVDGLEMKFDETTTVYERYGYVTKKTLAEYNDSYTVRKGEEEDAVDTLTIMTLKLNAKKEPEGHVLFMERITERPFVEAHWDRQHGRLMGVGEMENQMENQVGANMAFNLFRRQLLWSSKKIFQSPDEGVAKNLVKDVKDGEVLKIAPNGNITQVDMGNRAVGDFGSFSSILEKNSDQKSFTYEVATGEGLPSGTPFRLGVILSNSVNSHFKLKQEKLALMFKRAMQELVIPKFKREFDSEHLVTMFADEEGFESLKQSLIVANLNDAIKKSMMKGVVPNVELLKQQITDELSLKRVLSVKVPDSFYDDVKYRIVLEITGEEVDIPKKIETLTNLYTTMAQQGDPRSERVMKRILAYAGENYDLLAGPKPDQPALPAGMPQQQQQSQPMPQVPNQPSPLGQMA